MRWTGAGALVILFATPGAFLATAVLPGELRALPALGASVLVAALLSDALLARARRPHRLNWHVAPLARRRVPLLCELEIETARPAVLRIEEPRVAWDPQAPARVSLLRVSGEGRLRHQPAGRVPRTRGRILVPPPRVDVLGPLRLVAWATPALPSTARRVLPDLRVLRGLDQPGPGLELPGAQRVLGRRSGRGQEIVGLRAYRPGDEGRAIDWKATARTARGIVREHREERERAVVLAFDAGRAFHETRAIQDILVESAIHATETWARSGLRVGLLLFDAAVRAWHPPARDPRNRRRLVASLAGLATRSGATDAAGAARFLLRRLRGHAEIIWVTRLFDPIDAELLAGALAPLARGHTVLTTLHPSWISEGPFLRPEEEERRPALAAARLWEADLRRDELRTARRRLERSGTRTSLLPARPRGTSLLRSVAASGGRA